VQAIWPTGLGMPVAGGYSQAFKAAWQEQYRSPWKVPAEAPAQFFAASRLRSDLTLRALDQLTQYAHDYARQKGRSCKVLLRPEAEALAPPDRARWWRAAMAASLLAPEARGYEVAARPERLLLPAPPGSPAPAPTPRVLAEVSAAASELARQGPIEWSGGTRGI